MNKNRRARRQVIGAAILVLVSAIIVLLLVGVPHHASEHTPEVRNERSANSKAEITRPHVERATNIGGAPDGNTPSSSRLAIHVRLIGRRGSSPAGAVTMRIADSAIDEPILDENGVLRRHRNVVPLRDETVMPTPVAQAAPSADLEAVFRIAIPPNGVLLSVHSPEYVSQCAWVLPATDGDGYVVTTLDERISELGWTAAFKSPSRFLIRHFTSSSAPAELMPAQEIAAGSPLRLDLGRAPALEFSAQTQQGDPLPLPEWVIAQLSQPCVDGVVEHSIRASYELPMRGRLLVPPNSRAKLQIPRGVQLPGIEHPIGLKVPDDGLTPPLDYGEVHRVTLLAPYSQLTHLLITDAAGQVVRDATATYQGPEVYELATFDPDTQTWPMLIPHAYEGLRLCAGAPGHGTVVVPYRYGSRDAPYVIALPKPVREALVTVAWPDGYEPNGQESVAVAHRPYRDQSEYENSDTRIELTVHVRISEDGTCFVPLLESGEVYVRPSAEWLTFTPRYRSAHPETYDGRPLDFQAVGSAWVEVTVYGPDGEPYTNDRCIVALATTAHEAAAYPNYPGPATYQTLADPSWPMRIKADLEHYEVSCKTDSGLVGTASVAVARFGVQPVEIHLQRVEPVLYEVHAPAALRPVEMCVALFSGTLPPPLQDAGRFSAATPEPERAWRFAEWDQSERRERLQRELFRATRGRFHVPVDADGMALLPDKQDFTWHAIVRGHGMFPTRVDHVRRIIDIYIPETHARVQGTVEGLDGNTDVQVAPVQVLSPGQRTVMSGSQFGVHVDANGRFAVYLAPGRYRLHASHIDADGEELRFDFGPPVDLVVVAGEAVPPITLQARRTDD